MTMIHTQEAVGIREVFSRIPSTVAAIAAEVGGEPVVMVVSTFTVGVSYDPPLVSFAVQHSSTTWPLLAGAPLLGVSVLGERHAPKARQLASRNRAGRLTDIPRRIIRDGALLLEDAPSWFVCSVEQTHTAGDHDIVVLHVQQGANDSAGSTLIWPQH